MFSVNQCLLYGREIPADKHISESMLYHKLSGKSKHGKIPVYGKSYSMENTKYLKQVLKFRFTVMQWGHSKFVHLSNSIQFLYFVHVSSSKNCKIVFHCASYFKLYFNNILYSMLYILSMYSIL